MLARRRVTSANVRRAGLERQRRLKPNEIDELVAMYLDGSPAAAVAESFGINRETALLHLERRGIRRRVNVRKLGDDDAKHLKQRYEAGEPVTVLCEAFGINATTMRRELHVAGATIRRPGRPAGWTSDSAGGIR